MSIIEDPRLQFKSHISIQILFFFPSLIFSGFCLGSFFLKCRHDWVTYVDPSELEMLLRLLAPTSPVVKCLEGRRWLEEGAKKRWLWHRSGGTTSCDRWILLLLGELRFLVPPSAGTKIYNQQNNTNRLLCFLNNQNSQQEMGC